ncbi:TPA: hypothetical protein DD799_04230 [Candidatus Dependentiae bacterium]|nr:hypothetical protein [Candidatus Dependentiae bacterium]
MKLIRYLIFLGLFSQLNARTLVTPDSYYPRFRRHNIKDAMKYQLSQPQDKTVMNFFGEPKIMVGDKQQRDNGAVPPSPIFVDDQSQKKIEQLHDFIKILEDKNNKFDIELQKKNIQHQKDLNHYMSKIENITYEKKMLEKDNVLLKKEKVQLDKHLKDLTHQNKKYEKDQEKSLAQIKKQKESLEDDVAEIAQLKTEIKDLARDKDVGDYERTIKDLKQKIALLESLKEKADDQSGNLKVENRALDKEKNQLNKQIQKLIDQNKKYEKDQEKLQAQIKKQKESLEDDAAEIAQLKTEIKDLAPNKNYIELKKQNETLIQEKKTLNDQCVVLKKQLAEDLEESNQTYVNLQKQYQAEMERLEKIKKERDNFEKELNKVQEKYRTCSIQLDAELSQLKDEKESSKNNLHECRSEAKKYEIIIEELKKETNQKNIEYNSLLLKSDALKDKNADLKDKITVLKGALKNMVI